LDRQPSATALSSINIACWTTTTFTTIAVRIGMAETRNEYEWSSCRYYTMGPKIFKLMVMKKS